MRAQFISLVVLVVSFVLPLSSSAQESTPTNPVHVTGKYPPIAEEAILWCEPNCAYEEVVPFVRADLVVDFDRAWILRVDSAVDLELPQGVSYAFYRYNTIEVGTVGITGNGQLKGGYMALVSRTPLVEVPSPAIVATPFLSRLNEVCAAQVEVCQGDAIEFAPYGVRTYFLAPSCVFDVTADMVYVFPGSGGWIIGQGPGRLDRCDVTWWFAAHGPNTDQPESA